jgi:hypothetical protein
MEEQECLVLQQQQEPTLARALAIIVLEEFNLLKFFF